jgi:putative hemin transport protein
VSEAQLVASGCGESAVRLRGPWLDLLRSVEAADEVMALTRSEHAVHEKTAAFRNVREAQGAVLVEGGGVELRCELGAWRSGFAVTEETAAGPRDSLQFFDASGTAVHKIYRTNSTRRAPWESLVRRHRHPDQTPVEEVGAPPAPAPRAAMDTDTLRRDWQDLDGEEGLGGLLHRFGLERLQALQRLGAPWAREVTVAAPRQVLEH